jgi:hypothetical protein
MGHVKNEELSLSQSTPQSHSTTKGVSPDGSCTVMNTLHPDFQPLDVRSSQQSIDTAVVANANDDAGLIDRGSSKTATDLLCEHSKALDSKLSTPSVPCSYQTDISRMSKFTAPDGLLGVPHSSQRHEKSEGRIRGSKRRDYMPQNRPDSSSDEADVELDNCRRGVDDSDDDRKVANTSTARTSPVSQPSPSLLPMPDDCTFREVRVQTTRNSRQEETSVRNCFICKILQPIHISKLPTRARHVVLPNRKTKIGWLCQASRGTLHPKYKQP